MATSTVAHTHRIALSLLSEKSPIVVFRLVGRFHIIVQTTDLTSKLEDRVRVAFGNDLHLGNRLSVCVEFLVKNGMLSVDDITAILNRV